jgi:dynein heavy chain
MTNMLFADFQRKDIYDEYGELVSIAPFVYEACPDLETIRKLANTKLDAYNEKFPAKKMSLVIFDDALFHLLKIARIINTAGGNALLVGVGGSGKQSLTKLASFVCRQTFFQITLNKSYGDQHFKENVKELYNIAGPAGGAVTFILTDAEIKYETFLEAVNSMLATGEIPGLFVKEDRDLIPLQQKNVYMKEAGTKGEDPSTLLLWQYFINRVKDNLHTVLCFSPVGTKFRTRAQKFPSLFSQCNIDWFLPWPEEALISVSDKFLNSFKIDNPQSVKDQLIIHMGKVHQLVTEVCGIYYQQMRRYVYVTPKSYLSFIAMYQDVYVKKYKGIDVEEQNINNGLEKLAEATRGIDELKIALKKEDATLKVAADQTAALLSELEIENKKADIKASEVAAVTDACIAQKNVITIEKEQADKELAAAMPALEKAKEAVASIKPADIVELKGTRNATDTTRLIFDTVNILFQDSMNPVGPRDYNMIKAVTPFIQDSYDDHTSRKLQGPLLKQLIDFSDNEKDNINEETIELLEPYLTVKTPPKDGKDGEKLFTPENAAKASAALRGLCTWA